MFLKLNYKFTKHVYLQKELKMDFKPNTSLVSEFKIYDTTGRRIKEVCLNESNSNSFQIINCAELQSGLYFVRFQTENKTKVIPFSIGN